MDQAASLFDEIERHWESGNQKLAEEREADLWEALKMIGSALLEVSKLGWIEKAVDDDS